MDKTEIKNRINSLDDLSLALFYCNIATGLVSKKEYEKRYPITLDLRKVTQEIAQERKIVLPEGEILYHIVVDSDITPEQNIEKNLGINWEQLKETYTIN